MYRVEKGVEEFTDIEEEIKKVVFKFVEASSLLSNTVAVAFLLLKGDKGYNSDGEGFERAREAKGDIVTSVKNTRKVVMPTSEDMRDRRTDVQCRELGVSGSGSSGCSSGGIGIRKAQKESTARTKPSSTTRSTAPNPYAKRTKPIAGLCSNSKPRTSGNNTKEDGKHPITTVEKSSHKKRSIRAISNRSARPNNLQQQRRPRLVA